MADLSTNIPQISFGQADKETAVNELFDAASPSMLFGRNGITSAGLNFGIFGGRWNGVAVANKVLALTDNETLYISANLSTGIVTFQTGSFKTGEMPLYKVTTSGGLVASYEDHRMTARGVMAGIIDKKGKVLDDLIPIDAADLDTTLTAGGYRVNFADGSSPFEGAIVHVAEGDHPTYGTILSQSVISPVSGVIGTRYRVMASPTGWLDFVFSITRTDVLSWYTATTAEAPNAVINNDGTFSRSTAKVVTSSAASSSDGELVVFDSTSGGIVKGSGNTIKPITIKATGSDTPIYGTELLSGTGSLSGSVTESSGTYTFTGAGTVTFSIGGFVSGQTYYFTWNQTNSAANNGGVIAKIGGAVSAAQQNAVTTANVPEAVAVTASASGTLNVVFQVTAITSGTIAIGSLSLVQLTPVAPHYVLRNAGGSVISHGKIQGTNQFYGYNSGVNITTGSNNAAIGYNALYANTKGSNNTANGGNTLYSNTTGSNNAAIGYAALYSNTTGSNNVANGFNTLYLNTTGSGNAAIGYTALYSNTTGSNNAAIGYVALSANTTGSNNVASGTYSLYLNTTGSNNAANGNAALYLNTTGSNNTAIGAYALSSNTTGSNNTANGNSAGRYIADGVTALTNASSCTFIGNSTRASANNVSNETVIGNGAIGSGSNSVTLGNSSNTLAVVEANTLRLTKTKTPASSTAAGVVGDMCWDSAYFYVCVAANTWKRVPLFWNPTPIVLAVSTGTVTPTANTDKIKGMALTGNVTIDNPSVTPNDDWGMVVQLKSTAARTITWGSNYASRLAILPTALVADKLVKVGVEWDATDGKFYCDYVQVQP